MVYTRSQLSLLESPSPACSVDGESHKGSQGAQPKRRRTISCSSTNSSLDESFGSDSTRSSGSPAKPELRKREKKIQNRQTEPRRASRLMKYYVGTTRGSNEEHSKDSKPDLLPPEPDSTSPGVTDDQVLELEAKLSPGSNIGDLDSEIRIELLSEDSSNSETVIQLCSGDEEMQSVSIVSVSDERSSSLVGVSPDSLVKIIGKENRESSPTPVSSSSLCSSTTSNSGRLRVNIPNQVSQEDPYIDEIMDITSIPKLISPLIKGVASSEVCEYDCGSRDDLDSKVTQEATSVVDEMKRLDCLHEANTSVGDPIHSCTIETKLQSRGARLKEDDYVVDTKSPKQTEIEKSGIEVIDIEIQTVSVATPKSQKIVETEIHPSLGDPEGEPSEASWSDMSAESSLEVQLNRAESQKFPESTSELMLSLNSEAEYDSSMSNSYSESESTPIASSDSEDTRSPSPTDLKIPVLYTFDDSHDSVLEVSSSTASNNTDRSPVETSPPILTCVQNQSSCSDQETTSQFKCPGCCKCYLLLYPYKMHVVHCCPDLAPKGLPLTTTEKRKKIVIFSPQYIENLKLMKVQVSAKKRMSKLATISSPASPVISCSISPFNEQQRKSVSPSQSNVEVSKSPGVTSSISNVNTCLTSTSKNSPEKFESNCSNRSNSNNLQDTPLPGRLWSADTPMQLYAKKYFYSDKSRLVRKSDVQESFPRSGESKQHPTTGLLLQAGPEIEEKDKSKLADKSTIPAENVSEDVNDNNAHTSKQTAHQVRVSDSAASDSITAGIEEYSKMEADSKNVSLDSFFWEVIDHLFMKHMDRKKNTKSDQDSSFGTRSISSLIPGFGQTLSYSIPPVSFKASYPDETPEENLAHILIQLEFNQPGGFYCKHQKRVLTGFNNGRRNGWIPNQVVPRFLREAQKLLFKIPSVPARSKVAKKRIAQDVCDVSLTHNVWSSKGKLECNLECTGEKSITAEKRTSLSGVCHSLNPTGGRGEKNLKYFEDEYRRRKYSMDTDDNKCGKTFFAESGQNKSSAPNGKLISNLDKDYRQIVQQLEGPPSPIFADDG